MSHLDYDGHASFIAVANCVFWLAYITNVEGTEVFPVSRDTLYSLFFSGNRTLSRLFI